MKKLLLIIACLLTSFFTQSQETELKKKKKIEFGVAAGFDVFILSKQTGTNVTSLSGNRITVDQPTTSYLNLFAEKSLSERFGLRTEMIFAMGGDSNSLEIPIIFKYKALKKLNFYSGLQANFLLVEKSSVINRTGVGFNFGTEYYLGKHFFMDLRYVHKFSHMRKDYRSKNAFNSVRFGIGFKF